ncbi:MAG TPA: trehalose-phosphatase [Bacteroidota bacterium]|nr:trehalose-phosphatase [Bacteroidota bacterium]
MNRTPSYIFSRSSEGLSRLRRRIADKRHVMLFLDYDGTLTPITSAPEFAVLSAEMRMHVDALSCKHGIEISIVTGRSLTDIQRHIGLPGLGYAANHGLQILYRSRRWTHPRAALLQSRLKLSERSLRKTLSHVPGALIENKGLTLSIHYRNVAAKYLPVLKAAVEAEAFAQQDEMKLASGKKVLELKPNVNWGKGDAVRQIIARSGHSDPLVVYIGDDVTDEDAFAALPDGITVRVGTSARTNARYYVKNVEGVRRLLSALYAML